MTNGETLSDTRPYTLAAAFLASRNYASVDWVSPAGGYTEVSDICVTKLRHWREEFFRYRNHVYMPVVMEELASDLTRFLNRQTYFGARDRIMPLRVTRSLEGDVISQLRRICQVQSESIPCWLDEGERPDPKRVIAFSNGLLDIDEWMNDSDAELIPCTHEWFSVAVLPCNFDSTSKCPRWLTFLAQALDNDIELLTLLQEWFGYCLTGDTSHQKMLWLHGVSGAGKSTVVNMLRRVIGERNCVSFDLWSLLGQFTLSSFLGKRLATSADAHLGNSHEADKVLARLKGISGEDEQLVDRKNREMLSSVRLSVRFVISTNEFPNLPDASDALARRALFIPFEKSFQGEANQFLGAQLERELAGVTIWALSGLRRLLDNGRFSDSKAAAKVAEEFKRMQSPVHAFVQDCCLLRPFKMATYGLPAEGRVDASTFYKAYQAWSESNGRNAVSKAKFGERLKRAVPALTKGHPRDDEGNPFWEYRGIELTEAGFREFISKDLPSQEEMFAK